MATTTNDTKTDDVQKNSSTTSKQPPSKKWLPVEFGKVTKDNVEQLRSINVACFPVSYQETYYKNVVECQNEGLCKLAYYNGFVVGAACSRIEPIPTTSTTNGGNGENEKDDTASSGSNKTNNNNNNSNNKSQNGKGSSNNNNNSSSSSNGNGKKRIYIMTLGVLAAYRGRGIGTQLIQSIMDYYYESEKSSNTNSSELLLQDVTEMTLHVQISNEDAMNFYQTKFGFVKGERLDNYYRRIDPPHCYRLYKTL